MDESGRKQRLARRTEERVTGATELDPGDLEQFPCACIEVNRGLVQLKCLTEFALPSVELLKEKSRIPPI